MKQKYYFEYRNNVLVSRYVEFEKFDEEYMVVFELEENHDMIENFIRYKKDGTKMTDEEFNSLYPNYGKDEPSEIEIIKKELEVTAQAVQDLILMTVGGE